MRRSANERLPPESNHQMTSPRFSIVTPSYNQAEFLRRTIESVRAQGRLDDVEHLVIDGGSSDGSVQVLESYPHLQWISERDSGQTEALNKGIARARGEWIIWINSDDPLLPGALDMLRGFLEEHPEAQFIYSNLTFIDAEDRVLEQRRAMFSVERLHHWWRAGGVGFPQPGSIFRRELWERFGPFDEQLHYTMDFDFWFRLADRVPFLHLDGYLAAYRLHEEAKTSEGWLPFTREHMRVARRHWDSVGGWRKWKWRLVLALVMGQLTMIQGLRLWEQGDRRQAMKYLARGYARNPFSLLSRPHVLFWLRELVGRKRAARLRQWLRPGR